MPSPVKDVSFGTGLSISLNNYYDILKEQVGKLEAEEFLQLRSIADVIDLSIEKKASERGYTWFSYYNLLNRSDRAVQPIPVSGEIALGLALLSDVYGSFLRVLRTFVVKKVLTTEERLQLADIDKQIESLRIEVDKFYISDRKRWKEIAEALGYSLGDDQAYIQWSSTSGHIRDIQDRIDEIRSQTFEKKTILDRQYPEPEDREVIDAEFDFENPSARLRYPLYPDYVYPNGDLFNPVYLLLLPLGSTALFDDRRTATWDQTLTTMKTAIQGAISATFNRNTTTSNSITTDWSSSASGGYAFISVNASASEHRSIQEDFVKGQTITLNSEAAFRVNINFPSWFRPTLFKHKHVVENPHDFQKFFGPKGTLLYYPTALILIRGFSVKFESSQEWTFDYKKRFSASGGGGFNAFGISFGGSANYSSDIKEHTVDKSTTSLTIGDDKSTIRFAGYAVAKNTILEEVLTKVAHEIYGPGVDDI